MVNADGRKFRAFQPRGVEMKLCPLTYTNEFTARVPNNKPIFAYDVCVTFCVTRKRHTRICRSDLGWHVAVLALFDRHIVWSSLRLKSHPTCDIPLLGRGHVLTPDNS